MQEDDDKILKITTRIFIAVFIIVLITIAIRFFSKNILIDIMNVKNPFIQELAEDGGSIEKNIINVNWKEEYYNENAEKEIEIEKGEVESGIVNKYNNLVSKVKNQLEKYSSEFLFGYEKIIELAKAYENIIRWKLITTTDSDTPVYMEDGYWSEIMPKEDYTKKAQSIVNFSNYLKEKNIELIYVQAPKKTQDCNDGMLKIYKDHSNENIDNVVNILNNNKIQVLDLRDKIKEDKIEPKTLFYKTDHHWTPQAGIWAMNYISKIVNENWNMNINLDLYNINNYYIINEQSKYFGSQGRKLTLSKTKPEEFDIILPSFKTNLTVDIKQLGINNKTGNVWETLFEKNCLNIEDYYQSKSYDAYGYNSKAVVHVKNNNVKDDEKILLLADSFSGVLLPYFSFGVEEIYRVDLRNFDGSIKSFIEKNNITKVMMLYYPDSFYNEEAKALFEYN